MKSWIDTHLETLHAAWADAPEAMESSPYYAAYRDLKARYPEAVVFLRVDDFNYLTFDGDAETVGEVADAEGLCPRVMHAEDMFLGDYVDPLVDEGYLVVVANAA